MKHNNYTGICIISLEHNNYICIISLDRKRSHFQKHPTSK